MFIKFTIGRRIGLGFATFILITIIACIFTIITLRDSKSRTETVVGQVTPSVSELKELNLLLQRSHTNISKWFYNKSFNDIEFRDELKNIISNEYPTQKKQLIQLSSQWKANEKNELDSIFRGVERLFNIYQIEIIDKLNSGEAYEDPNIYMLVRITYEDTETDIRSIYKNLNMLIALKQSAAETVKQQMFKSFNFLNRFVQIVTITLFFGGIMIAFFTTRSITVPIQKLKRMLILMGRGILPKERIRPSQDEVGEMGSALNELVQSMNQTTEFARQTGSGNFNAEYNPLSKDDNLGHALLKMRDDLAVNEKSLERKVTERTEEVVRQKEEIEAKSQELETVYKQVTDSIHYAKRIQEAILPPDSYIQHNLPNSFVLYKPKDIVSGDFYWMAKKDSLVYFAAVDCTGHGVPGAFMSLVGYNILKDIIDNKDILKPGEIMDSLRDSVISTLHANKSGEERKDGMDMTLCCINYETLELQYSAAYNPLYLVRDNALKIYSADKFPIGSFIGEKKNFNNVNIQLQKNDQLFIFSDGYADQFGGPEGKKFMAGNFRELLLKVSSETPENQKNKLLSTLKNWQGDHEQVDDVLVIGVKI
jgi:serine phosphatase RsbU (regulator of sigma subunit)/HAMP domain-containing protein